MTEITIEGKSLFSSDRTLRAGPDTIGTLTFSTWRSTGRFTLHGIVYDIQGGDLFSRKLTVRQGELPLLHCSRSGAFRITSTIDFDGGSVQLQPASWASQNVKILQAQVQAGRIERVGWGNQARAFLPESVPLPVGIFLIWLAVFDWQQADYAVMIT